jgi:serine protease Do
MRYWGQFKGVAMVLAIGSIFMLIGLVIGSNLSIPGKVTAQPQSTTRGVNAPLNNFPNSGHSPFVAVAEEVTPAVVNISAESMTPDKYHNFMDDDFFRRFFGMPPDGSSPNKPSPRMRRSESLGSGFIISSDGYILTNNHVIEGAEKVTVTTADGTNFKADIIGADKETDVAVLKIHDDHSMPSIPMGNSDSTLVGDWVMAVGNPFPNLGLNRTVTVGVVSAKGRQGLTFGGETPSYQNYIQTDASINPGNSGGPLVDLQGEAIGINAAIATPTGGNVGIGFAIPMNIAKDVADQLMKSGKVERGYLGIYPQTITEELKNANGLPTTEGILVAQIDTNTPAEAAGLKVGDVITELDGKNVKDAQQFRFLIADKGPGSTVHLKVWRNGDFKTIDVKLGERGKYLADSQKKTQEETTKDSKWLGLTVETLTQDNADQYGVGYTPGAVITDVDPGSPADDAGLANGDIIMKIDGREVKGTEDFHRVADTLKKSSKPISFYIKRGQGNIFVAVTPGQ